MHAECPSAIWGSKYFPCYYLDTCLEVTVRKRVVTILLLSTLMAELGCVAIWEHGSKLFSNPEFNYCCALAHAKHTDSKASTSKAGFGGTPIAGLVLARWGFWWSTAVPLSFTIPQYYMVPNVFLCGLCYICSCLYSPLARVGNSMQLRKLNQHSPHSQMHLAHLLSSKAGISQPVLAAFYFGRSFECLLIIKRY